MPHETDETDDKLLEALENGGRTPGWLIDNLDLPMSTSSAVGHRLKIMSAAGLVENIGHGIYELPGGYVPARQTTTPEPTHAREEEPELEPQPEPESDVEWAINQAVAGWDDEPQERREKRIETLRCALEMLKEEPLSKKEIQERCYDDVPNQNARTWYRKTVRPALDLVAEYDNSTQKQHWVGR